MVIRSFAKNKSAQTISDISKKVGFSRAAVRRILFTLENLGYVTKTGDDYKLTARTLDLGFSYLTSDLVVAASDLVLEGLVEAVKASSSVGVLNGADVIYVARKQANRIMSVNLSVGSRLPALWTSLGRVLLSAEPKDTIIRLIDSSQMVRLTEYTTVEMEGLLSKIEEVKRQGWAIVEEELEYGLISFAVPIRGELGTVIAALNIGGQAEEIRSSQNEKEILRRLREAAREMEKFIARSAGGSW